jgi:hypothetical protein
MRRWTTATAALALPTLAFAGLTGTALTGTAVAATTNTPVAGVTASPSAVAVGSPATITVTATNTGSRRISQVALGVVSPLGWSNVVMPRNGQCRASTGGLLYCLVSPLGVGKTATLRFTVTPGAAGTFTFNSYARNIATGNETAGQAILTAQ